MTSPNHLSVAVPWSLTHYIPLNGFHPLYRALFDDRVDKVILNALDNIKLSTVLGTDERFRRSLLKHTRSIRYKGAVASQKSKVGRRYASYFDPTNLALTELLPGQIELQHTAPFPSLRRPFVFHCESFSPVFYPFAHQGTGPLRNVSLVRDHYGKILSSDQCLGIFSHIPETLSSLSRFFGNPLIDSKLQLSRIGISKHAFCMKPKEKMPLLPTPRFLFVNSAHQNPENFFLRGGHIVLGFWKELRQQGIGGRLYIRCRRPSNEDLVKNGVSVEFLKEEIGRSIIWVDDYLPNGELNALMQDAHFMLLPSMSLHSLSIMQAMALGAVPVVTDTIGTSVYVMDDENGIVLKGVRNARWFIDTRTNVEFDRYSPDRNLDANLISQLTKRVLALLESPNTHERIRLCAMERAIKDFSGGRFASEFWETVTELYEQYKRDHSLDDGAADQSRLLNGSLVMDGDWSRVFESPTQPNGRLYTGMGRVSEFGGAFVAHRSSIMDVHDWSPIRAYSHPGAPELQYSATIKGLQGKFLESGYPSQGYLGVLAFVQVVKGLLKSYPLAYKLASRVFKVMVRGQRKLFTQTSYQHWRPELILEGFLGYNVIRYGNTFYAIRQNEGAFEYQKIKSKGYSRMFRGNSISKVKKRIIKAQR